MEVPEAAARNKRRRYSIEADLQVKVEGELFPVRSLLLMLASPVFGRMLELDMRESQEGRIELPGKSKEEFKQVLPWLNDLEPKVAVTVETLPVLLRWAREYEIERLTTTCERFLSGVEVSVPELKLALDFGLKERTEQCLSAISSNIGRHIGELQQICCHGEVMRHLWPSVFAAAGLSDPSKTLQAGVSAEIWPLIRAAVAHKSALSESYVGQDVHFDGYSGCKIKRVLDDMSVEIHVPGVGLCTAQPGEWSLKKSRR
mmetsp:Transcript_48806/g.123809  ORF Transcript_48806/g.123809 Transcript_48806/m.123809 type:complete len:259 (-) Transcript_48806:238-1014(-)